MRAKTVQVRDGVTGLHREAIVVAPDVLLALDLLPGQHARCQRVGDESAAVSYVRLWASEAVPVATAECGALLLAQLGIQLGERVTLQVPVTPLLPCVRLLMAEGGAALAGPDLSHLAWSWRGRAVWTGCVLLVSHGGRAVPVRVVSCEPCSPALVDPSVTKVERQQDQGLARARAAAPIVGLEAQLARLLRCLDWALVEASGDAPLGLLVCGAVGSGKSVLVELALSQRSAVRAVNVTDASDGSAMQVAFRDAALRPPSVVVVDHLERLSSGRSLTSMMTQLSRGGKILVIGLHSGSMEALPSAVRTAFEVLLDIGALDAKQRLAMLSSLVGPAAVPSDLQLPGMVAGDVAAVAREARLLATLRGAPDVEAADVLSAVRRVHQHSARQWEIDIPRVSLDAIGGMTDVKRRLVELLDWPLRFGAALDRLGVRPSSGVLMYGPPGNGKTMMARAVATRSQASFVAVKGPELYSKYVGESERALEAVFVQARRSVPCVVFLDEIDALAPRRGHGSGGQVGDRVLSTLLSQLDGVTPLCGVTVLAATNRPDHLDPALLRPGRLSHHL
jgi:SpoVK/Ycf46/Vps4 family AAA+-type ATPase